MKDTILYYPTIKIKDGYWLRNAILYWDRVASIVPGLEFEEFDSAELNYLMEAGIYEPIYPVEMTRDPELCRQFGQEVKEKLARRSEAQRRRAGIRKADEEMFRIHKKKLAVYPEEKLHVNKMPDTLLDWLLSEGIASMDRDGLWIDMKQTEAEVYMAVLAKYLSKCHGNTVIGTDYWRYFRYPYSYSKPKDKKACELYLNVAMQKILPVPKMNVPIEEILDFRVRYEKELQRFRRRLDRFYWELKQCGDLWEMQEKSDRFRAELDSDLREIEEWMRQRRFSYARCALRTLVSLGVTEGVEALKASGNISHAQAMGISLVVGAAGSLVSARAQAAAEWEADQAYLFYAGKNGMIQTRRRAK